jgi:heme-degrading monooxygenase HmoA
MATTSFCFLTTVLVLLVASFAQFTDAFAVISRAPHTTSFEQSSSLLSMSTTQNADMDTTGSDLNDRGLLKRDRYVVTNRFAVRAGKAAKFEQRWATRKSKLASLNGFKYFHLMRRVTLNDDGTNTYDEGTDADSAAGNYVSFTIWEKKSDFSAWRSGEAFKEAHGGTSIGAFLSTMVNSAMVLRGAPRPAFYDGLLLQSTVPEEVPETVDGWRNVDADGVTTLPAECFVACNQFFVPPENGAAFEQRWAQRVSKLQECDGFVAFTMLRRDGTAKGHGTAPLTSYEPTYVSTTIWKDRASFDGWRTGSAFQKAHGGGDDKKKEDASPPTPLWSKPPTPVFYEGTLVISSEDGA